MLSVALAGSHSWLAATLRVTTVTTNVNLVVTQVDSTYFEGSLSLLASKTCTVTSSDPPPRNGARPTAQCAALAAGSPQNLFYSAGCDIDVVSGQKQCSALGALVGATGFIYVLQLTLLILSIFGFVSAVGIAHRMHTKKGASSHDGSWLVYGSRSLDDSRTLFALLLTAIVIGLVFTITWPSALANMLNLLVADAQSQAPTPQPGIAVTYNINPQPGAGYWVVFGAILFLVLALFPIWRMPRNEHTSGPSQSSPLLGYSPPVAGDATGRPAAPAAGGGESADPYFVLAGSK